MKVLVIGTEWSQGTSGKGPYAMASLYVATRMENTKVDLLQRKGETKGAQGAEMRCDVALAQKLITETHFPAEAELEVENVMRFGKPELKVINYKLLPRAAAATALKAA